MPLTITDCSPKMTPMRKTMHKSKTQNVRPHRAISQRNTSARNTTGVVGIALHITKTATHDGVYVAWSALVMVEGTQRRKTWSIGQWGYEGAWKKALAYRAKNAGTLRSRKSPPDKTQMAKLLKDRLGSDWRNRVRPAFRTWWTV